MRLKTGWLGAWVGTVLLLAAGCAPRGVSVPDLSPERRQARYESRLAQRDAQVMVSANLSLWASGSKLPDLPGVQARLLVAAPDAFRLRVESLFGTALDVSARGDSVTAYVPPRRIGLETFAARDSLGVEDPGGLGVRLWSATWSPPADSWKTAQWEDSLLVLTWSEASGRVRLGVGSSGLPAWAEVESGAGTHARYTAWSLVDGVHWPATMTIDGADGAWQVDCRIGNVRFAPHADPDLMAVRIPGDAERVTRAELRRAIDRLGKL